jgi:protein arginine N-methyltransferase 1
VMIPRRDVVRAAITEFENTYSELVAPWSTCVAGAELSIPRRLELNTAHGGRIKFEQLMSDPQELCTLDYLGDPSPNLSGKLRFRANRSGTAYGICVWFETELYEDIGFSSGPESPVSIYGQLLLPWLEPVVIEEGQEIMVTLHANVVGENYIWRWETEIAGGDGGEKVHFRQSTFEGTNVSSRTLRRHAVDHIPVLTAEGEAERFLLGAMDGKTSLEAIANRAAELFPQVYSSQEQAFERVSEVSRAFSR